jgi:hypothetical protein
MRQAGHVTIWGRGEVYTELWWGNLRKRDHLQDPGLNGKVILKWVFRRWAVEVWTGSIWLSLETVGGHVNAEMNLHFP